MVFTAEIYREAAREHIAAATELYLSERFVLANYTAGLAVECMFRAYRLRRSREFDSRHDLFELYKISGFDEIVLESIRSNFSNWLNELTRQWTNDNRYRSENSLRQKFKKFKKWKLDRSVQRGNFLKELTRRLVNAATNIVNLGVASWQE